MYSDSDLQDAVTAGIMPAEVAAAFRHHVEKLRASPVVDEEQFRFLTGFNDIFVSIAGIILMVALAQIGGGIRFGPADHGAPFMSGLLVAAASWGLAEYFTRRRRMALPSILLLGGFVGGVAFALFAIAAAIFPDAGDRTTALLSSGVAACTALAAWLHWRRFMVPVTVAAGSAAAAAVVGSLILAAFPSANNLPFFLMLAAGIGIFGLAMWWDISDRARATRRSDVAFWLHLTAAPLIAHSLFQLLGVLKGTDISGGRAVLVIALYILFGIIALAIDRRALLVSSLAYVLYALYALFRHAGAVELSWMLTALVIGSTLLLLSALWHQARIIVVRHLPAGLPDRLPYLHDGAHA